MDIWCGWCEHVLAIAEWLTQCLHELGEATLVDGLDLSLIIAVQDVGIASIPEEIAILIEL